jgi:hypothetical protein
VRIGPFEAAVGRNRSRHSAAEHRWLLAAALWSSTSTYKSDLVSAFGNVPPTVAHTSACFSMFLRVCGLLFALLAGSADKNEAGSAMVVGAVGLPFLSGGIRMKKAPDQLWS